MSTTSDGASALKPQYAGVIRELRKIVRLTQPQFAAALKVKRGAVAQWEGGTREPRYGNYEVLAAFAEGRNLPRFAELFRQQIVLKQFKLKTKREDKQQLAYAEEHFRGVRELAATGDRGAGRILKLSRMDRDAYGKYLVGTLTKEIGRLKNLAFSDLLRKLAEEASEVEELRAGYRSLRVKQGATDV
jgi:transcriptional regulator with XRE-family HTH domain